MSDKIICLTDYKNNFGSKWNATPYRSGLDKKHLATLFKQHQFETEFVPMAEVDFKDKHWENSTVLYTSSEEYGLHYKSFIEDIVFGLQEKGATLLPDPAFLRANNNKVFMEVLRETRLPDKLKTVHSKAFGTYDEMITALQQGSITFPCVVKKAAGAMSRGVFLAKNDKELKRVVQKISHTGSWLISAKEWVRRKKHKGYKPESSKQGKFIIQPFINGLSNDWKILIYGDRYFILKRTIKQNDFRASGSGYKYKSGSQSEFPLEMLDQIRQFYFALDVPYLSVDYGFDGTNGYIFEFQAIHFGTSTQYKSKDYYQYSNGQWVAEENTFDQEQIYVQSIVDFLNRKNA